MRSWNSVLACILFAYLILASAILLAARHFTSAPQTLIGRQEASHAEKIHDSKHSLEGKRHQEVNLPEPDRSSNKISAQQRANSPGLDDNTPDFYSPFTCTQRQVIDELELLSDAADCD